LTELASSARFDLGRAWTVDPRVALRPESFGALAYHFGTRRLSFLKSRRLLSVVQQLEEHPTGWDACRAAEVPEAEMAIFEAALARLAATGMIRERNPQ
jgi:putative mycofactocin binding protein MftB